MTCPGCGKSLSLSVEFVGRSVKCKGCGTGFRVRSPKSGGGLPVWAVAAGGTAVAMLVGGAAVFLALGGRGQPREPDKPVAKAKTPDDAPFVAPPDTPPPMPEPPGMMPEPPTPPPPVMPADGLGEIYQDRVRKLDAATKDVGRAAMAAALGEFRTWGESLRTDQRPNAREFAVEAEDEFHRRKGEYFVERAGLKLPEPVRNWPGLEHVPVADGFLRLFDGSKLHGCEPMQSPDPLVENNQLRLMGFHSLRKGVGAFEDFELDFEAALDDSTGVMVLFHYKFDKTRKTPYLRLVVDRESVELVEGSNRDNSRVLAEKEFDRPLRDETVDVRLICRSGKLRVFVNGRRMLETDAVTKPGRMTLLCRRQVGFKRLELAIFDKAPPTDFADDYPEDAGVIGSGTGWVVAPGGYLMTNNHVIDGPGRIMVRLAKDKPPVPADLIATDAKRDIAVIRLKDPSLVAGLRPLAVDTRAVERGEDVAAFGFPLSDVIGADLTLTQGVVSKTPAPDNDNLLVLSAVVNPGNSGGPLCDTNGNAVGLITYKIGNEEGRSYGGAVPAGDVAAFLKKHIPDFRPPPLLKNNFTRNVWKEVDGIVSPSVLMILKVK